MIKIPALLAAACFACAGLAAAQTSAPAPAPGKTAPTAAPSPATTAPLAVEDLEGLRGHLNETVDVRGTPTVTGHSKSGTVTYLNFGPAHQSLALVAFLGKGGGSGGSGGGGEGYYGSSSATSTTTPTASRKVQSEDDLKPFIGKPIIVHGKVADYKGDLQIVLDSLDQITLAPQ